MKINRLLYIGSILLLAGCTSEADFSDTLSGNGKTPLMIEATLNTGRAQTRASGSTFANGDVLKAYVQHLNGESVIEPAYGKKLVSITYDGTNFKTDSFWDDFSNSDDPTTDLRTTGHGLRSLYGYCYNGRTESPSPSLTENSGVLFWTVLQNQSTAAAVQHSDLLWSPTQAKVTYVHSTAHTGTGINHGTLDLPYSHAMSQITVKVIADDSETGGFTSGSNPLESTSLILNAMKYQTTLTAPNSTWSSEEGTETITMFASESYPSGHEFWREFVAIVAPGTKLKVDEKLLNILNVHGNNYTDTITATMIDDTHWGNGHAINTEDGKNYILTQPGKNYYLELTVKKSAIQAKSTLADWTSLTSTGEGKIYFPDDVDLIMDDTNYPGSSNVNVMTIDKNKFVNGATFSLFRLLAGNGNTNEDGTAKDKSTRPNDNNATYTGYTFATISTFQNNDNPDNDKWVNNPELFWLNNSDKFYYRALARFNSVDEGLNNISSVGTYDTDKGTAVSQGVANTNDILWGTTASHLGVSSNLVYPRGVAIPPRTRGVPIIFQHAMSKISFGLETTNDVTAVNLTGATIAISNIYTSATITLDDGSMDFTGNDKVANAIPATTSISNMIVVPQTFADEALVTITLPNQYGAIYTIPLKDCVVSGSSSKIAAWEGGKNYAYTIHVEKEKIKFNALVKDWDEVAASGNAGLNW